jgi:hypothetical protein
MFGASTTSPFIGMYAFGHSPLLFPGSRHHFYLGADFGLFTLPCHYTHWFSAPKPLATNLKTWLQSMLQVAPNIEVEDQANEPSKKEEIIWRHCFDKVVLKTHSKHHGFVNLSLRSHACST